jgi:hypothetical protein
MVISRPATNPLVQAVEVFSTRNFLVSTDEAAVIVADESAPRAGGPRYHPEPVADAEHRHPFAAASMTSAMIGEMRRQARSAGVAVAEAAGEHDRILP